MEDSLGTIEEELEQLELSTGDLEFIFNRWQEENLSSGDNFLGPFYQTLSQVIIPIR